MQAYALSVLGMEFSARCGAWYKFAGLVVVWSIYGRFSVVSLGFKTEKLVLCVFFCYRSLTPCTARADSAHAVVFGRVFNQFSAGKAI